ncbi:MAG: hypothetical protein ACKOCM_08175 [Cyanobacteriota bacterium]
MAEVPSRTQPPAEAAGSQPPDVAAALSLSARWLQEWENGELSDEVLADRLAPLVAQRDGARGFFVVALAGDSVLLDRLPDVVLLSLRQAGAGVVDLTVRNLAMSTAMVLHHGRQGDQEQQGRSERVQVRALELLRQLEPQLVKQRLEQLLSGTRGEGEDQAFLDRWGYDAEQRAAIARAVLRVAE